MLIWISFQVVASNTPASTHANRNMTNIKAVFFDLDETLVENKLSVTETFKQMYTDYKEELGSHNGSAFFAELSTQVQTLWDNMFIHKRSPERQLIECFEHCIAVIDSVPSARRLSLAQDMFDHLTHLSARNVKIRDHAESVIEELNSRGYITGIITNGIEQIQLSKIHCLKLQKQVDHITVSAQASAHKPHRSVFELALIKAGVDASQAWHVGDHPTNDVAGAVRAGLGGIYYNPKRYKTDIAFSGIEERPTHTIDRLSEVLVLLSSNHIDKHELIKQLIDNA